MASVVRVLLTLRWSILEACARGEEGLGILKVVFTDRKLTSGHKTAEANRQGESQGDATEKMKI